MKGTIAIKLSPLAVVYVNPSFTSKTCSKCDCLGNRHKHLFKCTNCGSYQHSDRNAAVNLLKLGESVVSSTAPSMCRWWQRHCR